MTATVVVSGAATGAITATVAGAQGPAGPSGAATNNVVDFVADGGADPTGATDCGAALTTCMNILLALAANPALPSKTLTLYIPPGLYQFNNQATISQLFNFANKATSLRITGEHDASIIYMNTASISAVLATIANVNALEIDHLAFIGSAPITGSAPGTPDCADIFSLASTWRTHIHHISILGLVSQYSPFAIQGDCEIDNVVCLASKAVATGEGIVQTSSIGQNTYGVHIHDSTFMDIGRINGKGVPSFTVDGYSWIAIRGPNDHVLIENVLVDEHVQNGIVLDGSGSGHAIASAVLRGITGNGAVAFGAVGHILAKNVWSFEVDGFASHTPPQNPYIALQSVHRAVLKQIATGNTIGSLAVVSADSGCGTVDIVDPSEDGTTSWTVANLSSSATRNRWNQGGVIADVLSTGAAVTANQLVKMTATGIQTLAAADATNLLFGVTQDTASGSGKNVRVARKDQRVTVLSDGATTIAVGDQITNSAATAGQVKKSTSNVIGIALTAATNVAGTAFDIQLL